MWSKDNANKPTNLMVEYQCVGYNCIIKNTKCVMFRHLIYIVPYCKQVLLAKAQKRSNV